MIKVTASYGAAAALGILLLFCSKEVMGALALAVFFHEAGHLLLLTVMGREIYTIRAGFFGLCITHSEGSYRGDAVCALAGPVCSILLALSASRGERMELAGVSFLLGTVNLLPVLPLDGGRVLYSLVCQYSSLETAGKTMRASAWVTLLLAGGIFLTALFRGQGSAAGFLSITALIFSVVRHTQKV